MTLNRFFTFFFLIVAFLNISQAQKVKKYEYNPDGSEYTVVFPGTPDIKERYVKLTNGKLFQYQEAIYQSEKYLSVMTAETVPYFEKNYTPEETKELLLKAAADYTDAKGWINVVIDYEENYLGKVVTISGYRKFDEYTVAYGGKYILGDYSILCVSYGAPSSKYPNKIIKKFIESIRR